MGLPLLQGEMGSPGRREAARWFGLAADRAIAEAVQPRYWATVRGWRADLERAMELYTNPPNSVNGGLCSTSVSVFRCGGDTEVWEKACMVPVRREGNIMALTE